MAALKAMNESAMDLRQFRYYIEGTEQMSFTRGARRASAALLAENQFHAQSAHDFDRNGNGRNAAPRTVPGARARNAFPFISDVQRHGVPLTATKAEDHMGCTFREIELECRVRANSESRRWGRL
jgi:hypothetical protein